MYTNTTSSWNMAFNAEDNFILPELVQANDQLMLELSREEIVFVPFNSERQYDLPYPYQWRSETLEELVVEGLKKEQQNLSKTIESFYLSSNKTNSDKRNSELNVNLKIAKRLKQPRHGTSQESHAQVSDEEATNGEKLLVFRGAIKRKNNKVLPEDNYQIKFSLK
jgi:hypothetical protein